MPNDQATAVDLDGTLARYDGWKGKEHIGEPVPGMLRRVRSWINAGKTVVIFTARAEDPKAIPFVEDWLEENGIGGLEVTNRKTMAMVEIWDDRAVQVKTNTGVPVR